MLNMSQRIKGLTHPLISDIYLKRGVGKSKGEDVLVIEARRPRTANQNNKIRKSTPESFMYDLLTDLEDLKHKALQQVGHFDRVDIRTH